MCGCAKFQAKQTAVTCSAQIFPKMDLGLEIQKTIAGITICLLNIPCVPIFSQNKQLNFSAQICPKKELVLEAEKSNVRIRINILETIRVPIFSQLGQL